MLICDEDGVPKLVQKVELIHLIFYNTSIRAYFFDGSSRIFETVNVVQEVRFMQRELDIEQQIDCFNSITRIAGKNWKAWQAKKEIFKH